MISRGLGIVFRTLRAKLRSGISCYLTITIIINGPLNPYTF